MRRLRPPVRPGTPPQLRLNLDFGTAKQREDYARKVLQQVQKIDAARAQKGFGSAFVSEDDKEGAINDNFVEERAGMTGGPENSSMPFNCEQKVDEARIFLHRNSQ
jgi:hypothetical protein